MALQPVFTKSRVFQGTKYPSNETEYQVEIIPGKSISIFRKGVFCNIFQIGDEASYGSYNLIYTGEIVGVSQKTVGIVAYKGSRSERRHNLDINQFCWRNVDFDASRAAKHNSEEMMYI